MEESQDYLKKQIDQFAMAMAAYLGKLVSLKKEKIEDRIEALNEINGDSLNIIGIAIDRFELEIQKMSNENLSLLLELMFEIVAVQLKVSKEEALLTLKKIEIVNSFQKNKFGTADFSSLIKLDNLKKEVNEK